MGFLSLILLLLFWPVLLLAAALAVILPFLGWALSVTAGFLLALNLALLLLLLCVRRRWRAAGRMDRAMMDAAAGWRRFALRAARLLLTLGVAWEALAVLLFAALLLWHPWSAVF